MAETLDMSEHIRQSNLIEGISDPAEVEQSLKAWKFLLEQQRLQHDVIRHVQQIITANQPELRDDQRGAYRDASQTNVRVGAYRPPSWDQVRALMDDWLRDMEARSPWINHVAYEGIHPFVDGNGRTGRMFMWWQEIRERQEPCLFKAADRFSYYAELERSRLRIAMAEKWDL